MNRNAAETALQELGFRAQFIAQGMEGFVFEVGESKLAKVWTAKQLAEVHTISLFYSQLREKDLPFATPLISEVIETSSGSPISIEERLPGASLRSLLDRASGSDLQTPAMSAVVSVVESLSRVGDVPAARELNVLREPSPWCTQPTWGSAMAELVRARTERYAAPLERSVENFSHKVEGVITLLRDLGDTRLGIVHGDICLENVLVDESTLGPTALIDFGFLTTTADPLFDATISTLIFDMYSPEALAARRALFSRYSHAFGQEFEERYPLYKATYALVTINAYSEVGEDGHFKWCADILNDDETNALVEKI